MKKIVLSAGGTGGHLFPAQALAEELRHFEIIFVGGGLSHNLYFDRSKFCYHDISCATFSASKPLTIPKACRNIWRGVRESRDLLRLLQPELVVGFGSFYTLPVLLAAQQLRIPYILHEQNTVPGRVNRFLAPSAHSIAITFPVTCSYLRKEIQKKCIEVPFPSKNRQGIDLAEARTYFGLSDDPDTPTLLVFGGSHGSRRLNELFLEATDHLMPLKILHFTGDEKSAEQARHKYRKKGYEFCVKVFEPRMDYAMSLATLAVTRAGAGTLSELIDCELPSILIPFPLATKNHQEINGDFFVSTVGGGAIFLEKKINADLLAQSIKESLNRVSELKKNINSYKQRRTLVSLAEHITTIVLG